MKPNSVGSKAHVLADRNIDLGKSLPGEVVTSRSFEFFEARLGSFLKAGM